MIIISGSNILSIYHVMYINSFLRIFMKINSSEGIPRKIMSVEFQPGIFRGGPIMFQGRGGFG